MKLFILFISISLTANAYSEKVGLKELVEYAFKHSPDLQNFKLTLDQSSIDEESMASSKLQTYF